MPKNKKTKYRAILDTIDSAKEAGSLDGFISRLLLASNMMGVHDATLTDGQKDRLWTRLRAAYELPKAA